MKYLRLTDGIVAEIIPEFDEKFPEIPLNQRYPDDFISDLTAVSDNADIEIGMKLLENGTFGFEVVKNTQPVFDNSNIEEYKSRKIAESKTALAEWLENNPYKHSDGKYYACTAEKQSLLNNNLTSYERAEAAGLEYPLKWNSTGDECTEWEYDDLVVLSLSIAAYVAPRVSQQQAFELEIKACETVEELEKIVIVYE